MAANECSVWVGGKSTRLAVTAGLRLYRHPSEVACTDAFSASAVVAPSHVRAS